jgi:hypothetical protein
MDERHKFVTRRLASSRRNSIPIPSASVLNRDSGVQPYRFWVMRTTVQTTVVHFNDLTPPGTTQSHWKDRNEELLDHSRTTVPA